MLTNKKLESGLLLDTHTWVWLNNGSPELQASTIRLIDQGASEGKVYIPAISVWEVATLASKKRLSFRSSLREWVEEALAQPGIELIPLSPEIAIESAQLPDGMHGDPADRLIIASARIKRLIILTRDTKILHYAERGNVQAMSV